MRYAFATGNIGASGSIEGVGKLHFLHPQPADSPRDTKTTAVHEFTHAVVLKMLIFLEKPSFDDKKFNEKFKKFPVWLWESVSLYESNELKQPRSVEFLKNGKYPSLEELNTRSKGQKIYDVGYTIVEYILHQYGKEKLLQLIASYGDVTSVLQVSEAQFSKNWHNFLVEKYALK